MMQYATKRQPGCKGKSSNHEGHEEHEEEKVSLKRMNERVGNRRSQDGSGFSRDAFLVGSQERRG